MKASFFIAIAACMVAISASSQGLMLLEESEKVNYEKVEVGSAGYASSIPTKHDMLKYAPPTMIQHGGTCVGFSTAYCAHSTMINKATETTDELHKYIVSFDPYFIYSIINSSSDAPCEQGLDFPTIFDAMVNLGAMRDLYPPDLDCEFSWVDPNTGRVDSDLEIFAAASLPFRISEYMQVDLDREDAMFTMKYLLSNDIPVIIGAAVNDDFSPSSYGGQIDANGVWNYKASSNGTLEGHAMCILGYDDNQAGGSFLVRNSWGEGFGIQGNFWLRYQDLAEVVSEAWCILPDFWDELIYQPNEYGFNMQDTGFEGIEYMRVTAEDGSSTYEGFYAEDARVRAFEVFKDGGVYFGEWVNFVKDGKGVLWTQEGEVYSLTFVNGELLEGENLGFGSAAGNASGVMQSYIEDLGIDQTLQFEGELPGRFE